MAMTVEKIEDALEMALTSLSKVAATGSNEERIAASKVLIEAVEMASGELRRTKLADRVLPLIDSVTRNLSGQLDDDAEFAPVFAMDVAQQSSLLMGMMKDIR